MEKADEYIIGDTPKPGGSERFGRFQILYLAFWKSSALMLTLALTVAMVSLSRVTLSGRALGLGSSLCPALSDDRSEGECLDIASTSQSNASFNFSSLTVSSVQSSTAELII